MEELLDQDFKQQPTLSREQVRKINKTKIELNSQLDQLKSGRIALYAIIFFTIFGVAFTFFTNPQAIDPLYILLEGGIALAAYCTLAYYFPKHPKLVLQIGLGLYLFYQLLVFLVDPTSLFAGVIVKVLIIGGLVRGLMAYRKIDGYLTELSYQGVLREELDKVRTTWEGMSFTSMPPKEE